MTHKLARRAPGWVVLVALLPGGCLSRQSFPMQAGDFVAVPARAPRSAPLSTRQWLEVAHDRLKDLLPGDEAAALTTSKLVRPDGRPANVHRHFRIPRTQLSSILFNLPGLLQSVVAMNETGAPNSVAENWPGFDDVCVPIDDHVSLSGRLGLTRRMGQPAVRDCIVLLPGLLGDNALWRTRDLALALLDHGFHVLALEPRGYGQTQRDRPDVGSTFGLKETGDVLAVAEWLQSRLWVRDTGLIGFCWGANEALLAAWEDGRDDDDPDVAARLEPHLRPHTPQPHYRAGVIAFSPTLRFEEIIDTLDQRWPVLLDPVLGHLRSGIKALTTARGHADATGSLNELIALEIARSDLTYPGVFPDGYRYLRLVPYRGRPVGEKLERARVPVLIVHAGNDPLGSAQAVADVLAPVENPRVAGLILSGGGHNGFASFARSYYYSLVLNFFDARRGALAHSRSDVTTARSE